MLSQRIVPYNPRRNLRSASKHLFEVPNVRLKSYGDRAFSVAAPKHWNDIPLDIKLSGSVDVFKSRLKTYLFRLTFNWLFVLVLLLVSYFLFLIVMRYRAFVYTAIQIKLLLLLVIINSITGSLVVTTRTDRRDPSLSDDPPHTTYIQW